MQAADAKRKKKKLLSTDINTTTFIQNTYDKWLRTKIYFTLCAIGMNFKHFELLSEGALAFHLRLQPCIRNPGGKSPARCNPMPDEISLWLSSHAHTMTHRQTGIHPQKGRYALAKQGVNTLFQRLNFHSHSAVRVFKWL
ncbi:hypothetical protein F0325_10665 [Enterobacter ludwigii]|nr:hypothetical protein F0325_10665 [Enterobacter ludwigii]